MAKKTSQPTGIKWFLNTTVGSYKTGIYHTSEVHDMPPRVRKYIQSLSSALSAGLLEGDMHSGGDINDIDLYAIPSPTTGELPELKGSQSGLAPNRKPLKKSDLISEDNDKPPSSRKLTNKLRDALQESAKYSTEDSLRAKVLEAKAKRNK